MAKGSRSLASVQAGPVQPVQTGRVYRGGPVGSVSEPTPKGCKILPAKQPVPVALSLQLDAPLAGGTAAARDQLNRPTVLIRSQDANFASCWFSRPIDFGDRSENPAFWMLQKATLDSWSLCLRRVSGELASYRLKITNSSFPLKLKRSQVSKDFKNWPRTITISPA